MIFLAATALGSGIVTAVTLAPVSSLAAIVTAPLVASLATVLAGVVLAHRRTADAAALLAMDAQTDTMVSALRSVAQRAERSPAASAEGQKVA